MDEDSFDRYSQWLYDYFPDPEEYDASDVEDFITKTNPNLPAKYKNDLVRDWTEYIGTVESDAITDLIPETKGGLWSRLKSFLGRFF